MTRPGTQGHALPHLCHAGDRQPRLQALAFIAGFASFTSFLWLAWSVGGYNPQLARVFLADVVALACLALGAATYAYLHMRKLT